MTRHRRLMLASLFMISLFGLSAGPQGTAASAPAPSEYQASDSIADPVADDSNVSGQSAATAAPQFVQENCPTSTTTDAHSGLTTVVGCVPNTSSSACGIDRVFVCSSPGKLRHTVTRSSFLLQQFPI